MVCVSVSPPAGIDLSVGPQLALVSVLRGQFIVVRGMNIGHFRSACSTCSYCVLDL